jgi:murein DD-endopeptidase MepM/ murein hydrolase activator NlpD
MSTIKLNHIKPLNSSKYEKHSGLLYRSEGEVKSASPNYVGQSSRQPSRYKLPSNNLPNNNTSGVKYGDKFRLGKTEVKVTDPFGIRDFEGRRGKHSTGIDYTTANKQAVALTDMEVVSVRIDGSGASYKPDAKDAEGKQLRGSAGYYIITKNSDGTMSQYMHLDAMTKAEMKRLEGKKFKRGDNIWGYGVGSGSMTGPHVKVRFAEGMPSSTNFIDPSRYFLGI